MKVISTGTGVKIVTGVAAALLVVTGCADNPNKADATKDQNSSSQDVGTGLDGAKKFLKSVQTEDAAAEAQLVPADSPDVVAHQKIVVVQNGAGAEGAQRAANGMKKAGKALGWDVQVIDGQLNANVQSQAVLSALSSNADGIVLDSIAPETIGGAVSQALQKKVPIVTAAAPNSPKSTPGVFADVSNSSHDGGLALAAWIAVHSEGKAQIFNVPDTSLSLTRLRDNGVKDGLKKFCTGCKIVQEQQNDIARMPNTLPSLMSSAVQKHTTDNLYVVAPFDSAVPFMIQGLKDAGAKGVPIVSMDGNTQAVDEIRAKDFLAATWAGAWEWVGWGAMDQMNRVLAGQKPANESAPSLLVDSTNLPPAGSPWAPSFDYEAAYKKIWGV